MAENNQNEESTNGNGRPGGLLGTVIIGGGGGGNPGGNDNPSEGGTSAPSDMVFPKKLSAYIRACPVEVSWDIYGRENRIPIHDAIRYIDDSIVAISQWCNGLGLCVVDGQLCAMYETT